MIILPVNYKITFPFSILTLFENRFQKKNLSIQFKEFASRGYFQNLKQSCGEAFNTLSRQIRFNRDGSSTKLIRIRH
jgi:hypothetical protein